MDHTDKRYRPWTDAELNEALRLHALGMTTTQIASELHAQGWRRRPEKVIESCIFKQPNGKGAIRQVQDAEKG
jgi:hypothetical protein